MASLASGLFDLFEGNPTEKEQAELQNLGGFETGTGEALTTAGAGFDESILSGDPTRIATALAPEISSQQGQVEQSNLEGANFGTRSGGTAAATEAAPAAERANIINLEGGLQSGAANSALSAGSGLLSSASSNEQAEAELARQRQAQVAGDVGGIVTGAGEIAAGFAGGSPVSATGAVSDPGIDDFISTHGAEPSLGFNPSELDPGNFQSLDLSMFE
jgi:hypothetical protein